MDIERRKYPRFSVQENTFAALGYEFETVGKVDDISIKGLSLSYLSEGTRTWSNRNFSQVYIFLSKKSFHLSQVPCKIVYEVQDPNPTKNDNTMKCRCGLHFGKLSKSQSKLLELFLENYTTRPQSS